MKICSLALISLLLSLGAVSAGALGMEPALMEARLDEMGSDREGAAGMYALWLAGNAGSAAAPAVFSRYFEIEQDFPALVGAGKKFLAAEGQASGVGDLLARIARILEIAGRPEEARDAYLTAFERGAAPSSLEAAFLISLDMNDVEAMSKSLGRLKGTGSARYELLDACLSYQKGDSGAAREALQRIASESPDPEVSLKALWVSYEIAARSGDSKARADAAQKLGARFPGSPEYALTQPPAANSALKNAARVVALPAPGGFFTEAPGVPPAEDSAANMPAPSPPSAAVPAIEPTAPAAAPAAPAAVQPAGSTPSPSTLSVQAGSFQMKENADDLVSELTRRGFSPLVRAENLQGKPLYRVFAGSALSADDARALLEKLHGEGFSGFLVKDR